MALRRFSLPIIFAALLLFSQVFARELEEKPSADKKDVDLSVDDAKYAPDDVPDFHRPCIHRRCHYGCCSEAEYAAEQQMNEFNDDKQPYGYGPRGGWYGPRPPYGYGPGYGHRPPYGYGPGYGHRPPYGYGPGYGRGCYYRCGYRCCSAEEYAEFVQAGN